MEYEWSKFWITLHMYDQLDFYSPHYNLMGFKNVTLLYGN